MGTNIIEQAQEEQRTERAREALHSESVLQIRTPSSLNLGSTGIRRRLSTFTGVQSLMRKESAGSFNLNRLLKIPVPEGVVRLWESARGVARAAVQNAYFQRIITTVILVNTLCLALDYHDQNLFEDSICRRRCEMDPNIPAAALPFCVGPIYNRSWTFDGQGGGKRQSQSLFCFLEKDAIVEFPATSIYAPGYGCSRYTDIDNCTAQTMCGWIGNTCKLGLYTTTTFAANTSGSSLSADISFRELCGGLNEVLY